MSVLINGVLTPPPGMKGGAALSREKGKAFNLAGLPDPLPSEVRDPVEVQQMFRELNLVPYAGTHEVTGDALRDFLISMGHLSATHAACIGSKKRVSLGKLTVMRRADVDFDLAGDAEVGDAASREFIEFVKTVNTGGNVRDLALSLYEDWEETGDQFVEIVFSTVLGVKSYAVHRHPPRNCKYLATGKGEQRWVAISPIWKKAYLDKNPPAILPLFPAFDEGPDGSLRSILHRRNGKNEWYGRPPSFGSWMFQYREFQDASYLVKVANNNFTGQLIVEVEDDNPGATDEDARRAGYSGEADRIHKNFTHQAEDPMTVWYSTRPTGARPMFVHQVEPNTAESFYKAMDEITEAKIIRAHQWSKRLMEAEEAGGLSTNVFLDALKSRLPVIAGIQEDALAVLNRALTAIALDSGRGALSELGLGFKSPYQEILEQTKETEQTERNEQDPN